MKLGLVNDFVMELGLVNVFVMKLGLWSDTNRFLTLKLFCDLETYHIESSVAIGYVLLYSVSLLY